jgi:signal transduction histidine kinase
MTGEMARRIWVNRRISVIASIILFLSVVIIVSLGLAAERRAIVAAATLRTSALAAAAAAHVQQVVTSIDLVMRSLDASPGDDYIELSRDGAALSEALKQIQASSDALRGIGVIDRAGNLAMRAGEPHSVPVDLSDRPYFIKHRTSPSLGLLLSPPVARRPDNKVSIPVSRSVRDKDGAFAGVIAATIDPGYFERFFRALGVDVVAITLEDGTVLARFPETDLLSAPRVAAPAQGTSGVVDFVGPSPIDGVVRFTAFRRLANSSIAVEAAIDEDSVLAEWRQKRDIVGGATAAILCLGVAVLLLNARYTHEVTKLRAMEATAAFEAEGNRRKSQFLAHMSHEIRTPLNAIIGFSQMIEGEMLGPIEQKRYRAYAADILHSAEHLLAVVNNILDFSKIEAGKWVLDESHFLLADLIGETLRLTASRAQHEGVTLVFDEETPPGVRLFADRRVLIQLLLNLMINAVKFAGEDRVVRIVARLLPHGDLVVSVNDRGPGMSAQDIARALQPFETPAMQNARNRQDTGLGLPLAAMFADLHGGSLRLESVPARGTAAIMTLPAPRIDFAT